jgi:DNA-binding PadR family transcriptional regulator
MRNALRKLVGGHAKIDSLRDARILSILANGKRYPFDLCKEYARRYGEELPLATAYIRLERAEGFGFVKSSMGKDTHERGGNRRQYFELSGKGAAALGEFEAQVVALAGGAQ